MPIYEVDGRRANVKETSVNNFLRKHPDAKMVSNIPYYLVRRPPKKEQDNPTRAEIIPEEDASPSLRRTGQISRKTYNGNSPFAFQSQDGMIADAVHRAQEERRNDPAMIFDRSVDMYGQNLDRYKEIYDDASINEQDRQSYIDDFNANIRTGNATINDKDIPPIAKEWLERNKQPIVKRRWIPANKKLGESGHWQEYTEQGNTPEQIELIKDYISNSAEGQKYAQAHKDWISQLGNEIDPLIKQGEELRNKATEKHKRETPSGYVMGYDPQTFGIFGNSSVILTSKAINLLKEAKKRIEASKGKGGFFRGIEPSGEDVAELLTFTDFLNDSSLNDVIDKYEKDPGSLTPEENLVIQAKYVADQITAGVDPGSWYNIGQATKQSLPFMRDFMITAGAGTGVSSAVKAGASALAKRAGAGALSSGIRNAAGNIGKAAIDLSVRPAIQTALSPSSYAMSLQEMQGQAVDRDEAGRISFDNRKDFSLLSPGIENHSEVLGEVVLDRLFQKYNIPLPAFMKTNTARRIASTTGIQNPVSEYLEEKESDFINTIRGRQSIDEFFDPRQNLEAFGAVAVMQIPFTVINATGYSVGKIRDIQAKRAFRQAYQTSLANLNNSLGQEASEVLPLLNNVVETGSDADIQGTLFNILQDPELPEEQKQAIEEYVIAYSAYSGINKAKTEEIRESTREIPALIEENANPQMGAVVSAVVAGYDEPIQIAAGEIVRKEDGSIDRDLSDQSVTIADSEGKRVPTSIKFVESISESIPTQEAIDQATQIASEPIIAKQENEEVRPYDVGETVRVSINGGAPIIGQISGIDESTGNYILSAEALDGIQQIPIEPRQIINEDNIQGIENGSDVTYINENGERSRSVVATNPDLYAGGSIGFENGDVVPIANAIGLSQPDVQPMPDFSSNEAAINNETIPDPTQKDNQVAEPRTFEIEDGLTATENSDGSYSLNKQYAKSELKKADNLVRKLNEDYSDNGLVFETVQLPRKDAGNPFERPMWGIVARTISPEPVINDDALPQTIDVNDRKKTIKQTPYQKRIKAIEPYVSTVRGIVLHGIASGAYKFRWKDKGASVGTGRELGMIGLEAERKSRISLLSNDGFTPATLSERIWHETDQRYNDNDIRSEIIDVLNVIHSPKQALAELEATLLPDEDTRFQQQEDEIEFQREQIRQDQEEVSAQLTAENIDNLLTLARE